MKSSFGIDPLCCPRCGALMERLSVRKATGRIAGDPRSLGDTAGHRGLTGKVRLESGFSVFFAGDCMIDRKNHWLRKNRRLTETPPGRTIVAYGVFEIPIHKDRLARSGFELIKWLIELPGGRIEILDAPDSATEAFDTQQLIGFITSLCNSHYGKRSAERRKDSGVKKDPILPGK